MNTDPIMGLNFFGQATQPQAVRSIDDLQELERRKQEIAIQQQQILQRASSSQTPIWDKIDEEVASLSDDLKGAMMDDEEFAQINAKVTALVQYEQLKLVKARVESSAEGKALLQDLLKATQRVKGALETAQKIAYSEYEAFMVASAKNPKLTLQEFRESKNNTKTK
jgi:hypothetical protein